MLLDAARSQLLVIDLQERLVPAIRNGERIVSRAGILLQSAARLGVPVTVTEQYPKGLGPTVPAVTADLPALSVTLPKMSFSAAADSTIAERVAALRARGCDQVVICGAEAHVCVLQSALGFRMTGLEIAVVADAVSSRDESSIIAARARLIQAGCPWVTTEMVLFEWLAKAGTDAFRALSPLIR